MSPCNQADPYSTTYITISPTDSPGGKQLVKLNTQAGTARDSDKFPEMFVQ